MLITAIVIRYEFA